MERNAVPCQPLHERHRCAVVEARIMLDLLLQDGEDPGRGAMAGLAGRYGRNADRQAVAIDDQPLRLAIDHQQHRPRRRKLRRPQILAGLQVLNRLHHRPAVERLGMALGGRGEQGERQGRHQEESKTLHGLMATFSTPSTIRPGSTKIVARIFSGMVASPDVRHRVRSGDAKVVKGLSGSSRSGWGDA